VQTLVILAPGPVVKTPARIFSGNFIFKSMGHSRKHPYHPHRGNRKLTPLPHSDVLIHLLLSETIFSPLLLRTAEISSVGGVWIFSGTTQFQNLFYSFLSFLLYLSNICVSVLV
jgi:hypothetical protein